jgi:1-acyl-sn-glycerol-3-phosphate acyltransferase
MKYVNNLIRFLFFAIFVRFVVLIVLGLNIRNRAKLPQTGPAIIIANHNSHLDTMVLMTLFKINLLPKIHPIAAADYFLKNRFLAWFSQQIIGIIPITRIGHDSQSDPLLPCYQALDNGEIIILFPEGTRGEPEKLSAFKKGISYLAEKYPHVPVVPIFMHGLGKSLPKGEYLLVPFFCDIYIGDALKWAGDRANYMQDLHISFENLHSACHAQPY